ncbi:Hypothetical predicted protein [Prunus dulcis]|uniref:Uncharacterized protein n=1 Tax=Prunus dulcis TaxID=3755 RepID=A0A5E4GAD5_PRUDU|nr:Hypothetical predicted protein [Prunus dulcis]
MIRLIILKRRETYGLQQRAKVSDTWVVEVDGNLNGVLAALKRCAERWLVDSVGYARHLGCSRASGLSSPSFWQHRHEVVPFWPEDAHRLKVSFWTIPLRGVMLSAKTSFARHDGM